MRLFTLKFLLVSVVAGGLMLAGAAGIYANAGNQNPDLIVAIDLMPDNPVAGDEITLTGSIANTTDQWQVVRACLWHRVNDLDPVRNCDLLTIGPKRVRTVTRSFTPEWASPGDTLSVRLAATNANGTSYATDSVTFS